MSEKEITAKREISKFELTLLSPQPALFVNGRQQVLLRILATMKEGREEVPLTETEIANLRIVLDTYSYRAGQDDDASAEVVPREAFKTLGFYGEWESSVNDKGYAEYPAGVWGENDTSFASLPRRQETKAGEYYFLLSCKTAGRVRSVPFCALLKADDGARYCTNKKKWDTDGKESAYNSDYRVNLETVDLPVLTSEHITAHPESAPPEHGYYNIVHPLQIVYTLGGSPVRQKNMTVEPAGMIQWPHPDPGENQASFTGYASPGATKYTFHTGNPVGAQPLPVPLLRPEQGVLVLCGRNDVPYQTGTENGPCLVTFMDIYGNEHRVSVEFSGPVNDGRHSLKLTVQ